MSPDKTPIDDWYEYKRLVLAALEQAAKQNETLTKKLSDVEVAIATLQTKASVWGAIAGVGSSLMVALIVAFTRMKQ
jgi:hypothetical protein